MRVFIAQKYELGERWDPMMVAYRRNLSHFKYQPVSLASLLISPPQYGANESGIKRISEQQVRYIRITDINDNGLLNNNLGATVERINAKYILNHNDLLFARSGATVGKTFLYKKNLYNYPCLFAGYLIKFQLNPSIVIPDYLFIYTQLSSYKDWIIATQRAAAQPNINAEEYKSLQVPLPPLTVQNKIYEIYHFAVLNKQKKEQEAKDLLDSIDDYLLSELGIERPERTENGRFFYTSFREIEGKRIDPYYNHPYFKKAYNSLHKTPYPVLRLGELSTLIASGSTPPSGGEDYTTKENGIMFVRSGDITNDCNIIDSSDMLYITKECHNTKMRQSQLRYGDILIAIVGATIGAVNIYNYNAEANINQAIALVRLKSGINELFITEELRSSIGRLNLEHQKRPVARANINLDEIAQMELILPPLEIQDKIAENIQSIRDQAKYLQQEAKEIINNAKQKIEQMILGK